MPLVCWGGVSALTFCLSLLPFYSSFLPPEWGPESRYLSYQPFPLVVGSGCKDREVWPCQTQGTECNSGSLSLRHFRFLRCHFLSLVLFLYCGMIWIVITSGRLPPLCPWLHPCRGGFFPWPRRGFSLDWALGLMWKLTWTSWTFTPHNSPSKSCCLAPWSERRVLVTSGLCHGLPNLALHLC